MMIHGVLLCFASLPWAGGVKLTVNRNTAAREIEGLAGVGMRALKHVFPGYPDAHKNITVSPTSVDKDIADALGGLRSGTQQFCKDFEESCSLRVPEELSAIAAAAERVQMNEETRSHARAVSQALRAQPSPTVLLSSSEEFKRSFNRDGSWRSSLKTLLSHAVESLKDSLKAKPAPKFSLGISAAPFVNWGIVRGSGTYLSYSFRPDLTCSLEFECDKQFEDQLKWVMRHQGYQFMCPIYDRKDNTLVGAGIEFPWNGSLPEDLNAASEVGMQFGVNLEVRVLRGKGEIHAATISWTWEILSGGKLTPLPLSFLQWNHFFLEKDNPDHVAGYVLGVAWGNQFSGFNGPRGVRIEVMPKVLRLKKVGHQINFGRDDIFAANFQNKKDSGNSISTGSTAQGLQS